WANGDASSKSVDITVNGDTTVEADETIALTLQNVVGAALGVQTTATITITNDDVPLAGTVEFADAAPTVNESAGSVTLTVNRVNGSAGALSVNFATSNGTAVSNGNPSRRDFAALSGTLNWAALDVAPKTIVITINNNDGNADAAAENFRVTLTSVGGSVITGTNPATVTINDD
ncbi:MAG TPA: Calx-beta domain-containing protein, partial [Planctomycetota bacterium]|nr:Calx-beta domain-containing protein [Planctomycetota bacterium]